VSSRCAITRAIGVTVRTSVLERPPQALARLLPDRDVPCVVVEGARIIPADQQEHRRPGTPLRRIVDNRPRVISRGLEPLTPPKFIERFPHRAAHGFLVMMSCPGSGHQLQFEWTFSSAFLCPRTKPRTRPTPGGYDGLLTDHVLVPAAFSQVVMGLRRCTTRDADPAMPMPLSRL
jgi:hypothetical protein